MNKISVLIPTYNSPDSLDLLIRSLIEGASDIANVEILIGVDGTKEQNQWVIDKWENDVKWLILDENVGLATNTNLLVYNASNELILILNDDNVAPINYDICLPMDWEENVVLTPNQIEPFPSIFEQFHIEDFGRDPKTFDLQTFWDSVSDNISRNEIDSKGSTLPIFMSKYDYLRVGGWDPQYGNRGLVSDHDFLLKCALSDMEMKRTYSTHFYHFVSLSDPTPEQKHQRQIEEREAYKFAKYKWGSYIMSDKFDNKKYIS
jgi:GT2 family glycosyltransferase